MKFKKQAAITIISACMAVASVTIPVPSSDVEAASVYSNCKTFNKSYPHGVRKTAATKNKVKKRNGKIEYQQSKAKVSATIYNKAIKANSRLDADKDNIACEK